MPMQKHINILKKTYFIGFVWLLSLLGVQAQQIKLTVLDADTKEPVSYAHVKLEEVNSQEVKLCFATFEGVASVKITSCSVLSVQAMGYKLYQDTICASNSSEYKVYLHQDIFSLDELVVTATRTQKSLKDVPVITQVINAKEIENKGIDNVQVLLETALPGIEFQRHGTSQDIDIQGLGGRNILILVDGERLAGETRGNIDYERINTADIQKVEIIKGASSALYGSQAMGAVVNIITKNYHQKFYVELLSGFKTNSERNFTDIKAKDPNANLKRNLDRGNNEHNLLFGFNLKSWKAKTVLSLKNIDGYTLYDTDSLLKKFVDYDTIVQAPRNTEPTGIEGEKQFSITQKVSYQWSEKLKAEANIKYYNRHKYDFYEEDKKHDYFDDIGYGLKLSYDNLKNFSFNLSFNSDTYNKYDYKERLSRADLNYKDRFLNPKAILVYKWNNHQSLLGLEFLKENLLTDMFVYGQLIDKRANTYTVFLQDDFQWTEKLSLVTGVRGQYNTAFEFQFTPKLALMYAFYKLKIRANYAMGYRSPGLKELYMNWNHLDMFMIEGNPDLRPETNHYTSLSAEYTQNKFNASVSVFNNAFQNKIDGQWADNQTIYRYANTNRSRLYGCDATAKVQLGQFSLSGSYSYVNEAKRKEGIRLSAISPHTANAQVAYRLNKANYRLNVNLGMRYIGTKDFFVQEDLIRATDTISAYYPVAYKGYVIGRVAIHQQFYKSVAITAGIENLFNYKAPMVTFNSYTGNRRLFFIKIALKFDKFLNKII
ncbi:MAG: hypothetical protein CSA36_07385 [Draconibacterium sp.]|nr:MAG: hypothetical protein CSA36_07385 [Draconibacterium sp.]